MPELPEVETTVRDLSKKILRKKINGAWTDLNLTRICFAKLKNKEIKKVWRRGKNIIIDLSGDKSLLIHQKMTGRLLYGKWKMRNKTWTPEDGCLKDKANRYIHLVLFLDNGKMLALSDLRKFAKIELWERDKLLKELESLGA